MPIKIGIIFRPDKHYVQAGKNIFPVVVCFEANKYFLGAPASSPLSGEKIEVRGQRDNY